MGLIILINGGKGKVYARTGQIKEKRKKRNKIKQS
jgi:hypothetical protein